MGDGRTVVIDADVYDRLRDVIIAFAREDAERKHAGMTSFAECPDCGAPKQATRILGFACQHKRCPMMDGITPTEIKGTLSYDDACHLSRSFNENANLQHAQDYRINEWLKKVIMISQESPPRPPLGLTAEEMCANELGRQPRPVRIVAIGDLRDVDYYLRRIKSLIESGSYDACERMGNQLKIYPRAVND